jgi:hypothetical protein
MSPYTVPIFQSCFLLIFKLMFKGVCLNVCPLWVCFTIIHSPPPITLPYPHFQQFSIHILICSTFRFYVMLYYWCSILLFSFLPFLKFHRVVPILQTHSISKFVLGHVCFCVYVDLWIDLLHVRENMQLLCFWAWLTLLSMMSSSCIHLPQPTCHYSLWLSNTPLCTYHIFLIHLSVADYLGYFQSFSIVNQCVGASIVSCLIMFLWVAVQ